MGVFKRKIMRVPTSIRREQFIKVLFFGASFGSIHLASLSSSLPPLKSLSVSLTNQHLIRLHLKCNLREKCSSCECRT